MKITKVSVSLQEELVKYGSRKVSDLGRKRGSRVTFSSWVAELIARDKQQEEPQKQSA